MKKYILLILLILNLSSCSFNFLRTVEDEKFALEMIAKGILHLRAGNLDDAEAAFLLANEIVYNPAAIDGLGCVEFNRGNFYKAERLFIDAFDENSNYFNSLGNLALLYEMVGHTKEANKLYQIATSANPKNYKIKNNFGGFLFDNYNNDSYKGMLARQEILKAKNIHPDNLILSNLEIISKE